MCAVSYHIPDWVLLRSRQVLSKHSKRVCLLIPKTGSGISRTGSTKGRFWLAFDSSSFVSVILEE